MPCRQKYPAVFTCVYMYVCMHDEKSIGVGRCIHVQRNVAWPTAMQSLNRTSRHALRRSSRASVNGFLASSPHARTRAHVYEQPFARSHCRTTPSRTIIRCFRDCISHFSLQRINARVEQVCGHQDWKFYQLKTRVCLCQSHLQHTRTHTHTHTHTHTRWQCQCVRSAQAEKLLVSRSHEI